MGPRSHATRSRALLFAKRVLFSTRIGVRCAGCLAFRAAGADVTFLEAPRSVEEMRAYCEAVPGPKLANMCRGLRATISHFKSRLCLVANGTHERRRRLEHGRTPVLPPAELGALGFAIAAYPLTLLSAATKAQLTALERLKNGKSVDDLIVGSF